jgi:hypothetical protein
MRTIWNLLGLAAFSVALCGCGSSGSTGGTPGTKETFTLKSSDRSIALKQGDRQTVKLTVDRSSGFKQAVKLDATVPKGVKAEFGSKTVAAADAADVTLTVEADKDAAIGEHKIHVTATPEKGDPSVLDVVVKVEEKK